MPDQHIDRALRALGVLDLALADDAAAQADCRAHVHGEIRRPSRRRGTALLLRTAASLAVAVSLVAGAYAVPATRAAVDDLLGVMTGWVSDGPARAPGDALRTGADVPSWVAAEEGQKRVLATADGEQLIAIRRGDRITFALRDFGTSGTLADLRSWLDGRRITVIGPGHFVAGSDHRRRTLFGIVTPRIDRVVVGYADGGRSSSEGGIAGGFGLVVDADRRIASITGFDGRGAIVARVTLGRHFDLRYCPWRGCTPWRNGGRSAHATNR